MSSIDSLVELLSPSTQAKRRTKTDYFPETPEDHMYIPKRTLNVPKELNELNTTRIRPVDGLKYAVDPNHERR